MRLSLVLEKFDARLYFWTNLMIEHISFDSRVAELIKEAKAQKPAGAQ